MNDIICSCYNKLIIKKEGNFMQERKYIECAGNMVMEIQQIEKLQQPKDAINPEGITEGWGGFLTLICC